MGLSDSPGGPAGPSRVSGWVTHPPPGVSRVACFLRVPACRRPYPGGRTGAIGRSGSSRPVGLPHPIAGSASTRLLSGPARRSLHVTACLLAESPEATLSIGGFGKVATSLTAPISTGCSEPVCRWALHPLYGHAVPL